MSSRCPAWLLLGGLMAWTCAAPAAQGVVTLDTYLQQLGYLPLRVEVDLNHFYVRGVLKGKTRSFVVDTGCGITRLDPSAAGGLEPLDLTNRTIDDEFLEGARIPGMVIMDELKLGGLRFRNQPAVVGELAFEYQHVPEKGLLGCDFFFRNHCLIDCLHGLLYIRPEPLTAELESVFAASLRKGGFSETDLKLTRGFPTMCTVKINGVEFKLVLDTGSPWTILDWDCAKALHLTGITTPRHLTMSGLGKAGTHDLRETQLQTLQLAGATLKRRYVAVADMSAWGLADRGKAIPDAKGLLGMETLATAGALIDFGAGKLWVCPPPPK